MRKENKTLTFNRLHERGKNNNNNFLSKISAVHKKNWDLMLVINF